MKKDVFVVSYPCCVEQKTIDAICKKMEEKLGDDVVCIVLDHGGVISKIQCKEIVP